MLIIIRTAICHEREMADIKFYMYHFLTLLRVRCELDGSHCSRQTPPCSVQG